MPIYKGIHCNINIFSILFFYFADHDPSVRSHHLETSQHQEHCSYFITLSSEHPWFCFLLLLFTFKDVQKTFLYHVTYNEMTCVAY